MGLGQINLILGFREHPVYNNIVISNTSTFTSAKENIYSSYIHIDSL